MGRTTVSSEGLGANLFLDCPGCWCLLVHLGVSWLVGTWLRVFLPPHPCGGCVCVCTISLCFSLIRTLGMSADGVIIFVSIIMYNLDNSGEGYSVVITHISTLSFFLFLFPLPDALRYLLLLSFCLKICLWPFFKGRSVRTQTFSFSSAAYVFIFPTFFKNSFPRCRIHMDTSVLLIFKKAWSFLPACIVPHEKPTSIQISVPCK